MLWRRKRPSPERSGDTDQAPAAGRSAFSESCFKRHMAALIELAAEDDGPHAYVAALANKHRCIAESVALLGVRPLDLSGLEALLAQVFTARRRLYPALVALGAPTVSAALGEIVGGEGHPHRRLQAFVDLMPGAVASDRDSLRAAARVRRAAWDFAAEVLHFHAPERYPLMTRWVWDGAAQSGALNQFVPGREPALAPGLDGDSSVLEDAHAWLNDSLRATGIYRDHPFWADLLLARAYVEYLGAATRGHFGADFVRGTSPREQLRKLLGIDRDRALGRSRVRLTAGAEP